MFPIASVVKFLVWVLLPFLLVTAQNNDAPNEQSNFLTRGAHMGCGDLVSIEDFKENARRTLERKAFNYVDSAATLGLTRKKNRDSFNKLILRPHFMVNVSNVDMSTTVLGQRISIPIGTAPAAAHKVAHPDGEIATVRAVSATGAMMIISTYSTVALEDIVANAAPNTVLWFQVYIFSDRSVTYDLVKRAEMLGIKALVLGVDVPALGIRYPSKKDKYFLPQGESYANFLKYGNPSLGDPSTTWNDAMWLRSITTLPIVAKGILTVEDAQQAVQCGANGIIVSNHGGRQLDSSPATIDVLSQISLAVNGKAEIYLDSGIRTGGDILKALGLGARAVFIGRPLFYGLAYRGEVGLRCVIENLADELENSMVLSGTTSARRVNPQLVHRPFC